MNIQQAHENWTALGKDDPMWVVLTDPSKKGNRWDEQEFFATGRKEIAESLARVRAHGLQPGTARALDFGCGLGRLSQALAEHFAAVDGVDISTSMVEQARKLDRSGGRVTYHLNVNPDLRGFTSGSFDFIFSVIALQHTPSQFQLGYLADFARLLKPGGVACFQNIHALGWRRFVPHSLADAYRRRKHHGQAFIPMYGTPVTAVRRALASQGGEVADLRSVPFSECPTRYVQDNWLVVKRA